MTKDYSLTQIYMIKVGGKRYIGHTTSTLKVRRNRHVTDSNHRPEQKLYKAMHDAGWSAQDIQLIWIEDFPCPDKAFAEARERAYIKGCGSLNCKKPKSVCPTRKLEYREVLIRNRALKGDELGRKEREAKRVEVIANQHKMMQKAYRQAHKETIAEKKKAYRQANKEALVERRKAYREAHKEKIAEEKKAYQQANKEKIAERKKAYQQAKKATLGQPI